MEKTVILIVGLGQIGSSIGLALAQHSEKFHRVGHTRDYKKGEEAKKTGVVDEVSADLVKASREADIVVLALPLDVVQDGIELVAADLKEGAVVLDCSPARQAGSDWAVKLIPKGRDYIGFTPVLNPESLLATYGGAAEAHEYLFQNGMFAITSPVTASSNGLKAASDLAAHLGAAPLFADTVEIDSYMSSVHVLPQLLAACVTNITVDRPGWGEKQKITGRPYAQLTNLISSLDRASAVALSARLNKEHVLRSLDELILELQAMRTELASEETSGFDARMQRAGESQERWWEERREAKWLREGSDGMDEIGKGGSFGQLF